MTTSSTTDPTPTSGSRAPDGPAHGPTTTPGPSATRTLVLRWILATSVVVALIHYADNTIRWHHYIVDDPSFPGSIIQRWVIPTSLVVFLAAGALGYLRFVQGRYRVAAALLGFHSLAGLVSLLHYRDVSWRDYDAFQNGFVALDVAVGIAMAAFAIQLVLRPPDDVVRG